MSTLTTVLYSTHSKPTDPGQNRDWTKHEFTNITEFAIQQLVNYPQLPNGLVDEPQMFKTNEHQYSITVNVRHA